MKKNLVIFLLTVGMAMALIGCSANQGKSSDRKLIVFNYGDYIEGDVLDLFEKETGIKVEYEQYITPEDMYTKYKSGVIPYDVICTSDYMIEKMIQEGEVRKLDWDQMKYKDNLDPVYLDFCKGFDPGNKHASPYFFGTVGILYNTEEVQEEVKSWGILWDKKYQKDIIMENSMRDAFLVPLKWKGHSLNTKDRAKLKEAQNMLVDQKPLVGAYLVDESRDTMIAGDASLAVVYSGDATEAMDSADYLDYAVPEEGTNIWFDCWFIPKSAEHVEEAQLFIDFMNREDIAAMNFDYIWYGTPNRAVYDKLDEETKEDSTIFPSEEILKRCEVYTYLGKETEAYYARLWKELKAY